MVGVLPLEDLQMRWIVENPGCHRFFWPPNGGREEGVRAFEHFEHSCTCILLIAFALSSLVVAIEYLGVLDALKPSCAGSLHLDMKPQEKILIHGQC